MMFPPATITFWHPPDNEWVRTFIDEDLRGLSGLGPTPHDAWCEVMTAYHAWQEDAE